MSKVTPDAPEEVAFRMLTDETPAASAVTDAEFRVHQSMFELAVARSRAAIAREQAKIAQMEAEFCELVLKVRTQPQKS